MRYNSYTVNIQKINNKYRYEVYNKHHNLIKQSKYIFNNKNKTYNASINYINKYCLYKHI